MGWLKRKFRMREDYEKLIIVDGDKFFIEKWTVMQSLMHVGIMTMIMQVITGFPLKYWNTPWAKYIVKALGGINGLMTIHRVEGAIMFFDFLFVVFYCIMFMIANRDRVKKYGFWDTYRLLPGPTDVAAVQYFKYLLGFRKSPPDYDEYMWVDKFDFFAVGWGMIAIGITGWILWLPEVFTGFLHLPPVSIQIAFIAHADEGMVAVGWIALVHLYMAHYSPHKFPMDWVWLTGISPELEWMEERPRSWRRIIKRTAEHEPELLEKYPALKERYEFVKSIENLPNEEIVARIHEYAHHLLEKELSEEAA